VDEANKLVSRPESIRRFTILPVDLTEAAGHLTPSMKLKRDVIAQEFASWIEEMYAGPGAGTKWDVGRPSGR
jgi:long-chain acyl-CoA synthetase